VLGDPGYADGQTPGVAEADRDGYSGLADSFSTPQM
jgi:hypothetical protein